MPSPKWNGVVAIGIHLRYLDSVMKIDIITICDYAKIERGCLSIIDSRDFLEVPRFPWRVYFGIAVKGTLMHDVPKGSFYVLTIFKKEDIEEADNGNLSDNRIVFKTTSPAIEDKGKFAIAGNIRGLIFNEAGDYIFRIESSDRVKADYTFRVVQSKEDD